MNRDCLSVTFGVGEVTMNKEHADTDADADAVSLFLSPL